MKTLDSKLLRKFLKLAGDSLQGKWLLVGGTLLPALGVDIRSTVDIDLIGLGAKEDGQTLELMGVAEKLGLSVETINQAAAYFLKKVKYDKEELLPLHKGKNAEIFRPSLELYWKLKMGRLSESDTLDCQHYFKYCVSQKDQINLKKLNGILVSALKEDFSPEHRERVSILINLLTTNAGPSH